MGGVEGPLISAGFREEPPPSEVAFCASFGMPEAFVPVATPDASHCMDMAERAEREFNERAKWKVERRMGA